MKSVIPEEARELLKNTEDILLLDVREEEEWELSHIPSCVLLPLSELEAKAEEVLEDKTQPILVYCHSGRRSLLASSILESLGYTNIFNLLGGILAWPYEKEKVKDWH
ncbi:MAG: rhodanese-like domain-containing protein [Spirochaetales bacterium]|nr:rhodanese-like domain-containing protein [Candidatus Physcosoma equi]